jgi:type II secretory pathway pseudopilin PulG
MRLVCFSRLALLFFIMAVFLPESSFSQTSVSAAVAAAGGQAPKTNPPAIGADAERESLQDLTARILKLEIEVAKPKPKGESEIFTAIIAGFAGLIAALVGGVITLAVQRMTAQREREREITAAKQQLELARETAKQQLDLSMKQAVFAQTEKILEFRVKQIEYFYAPMFALLKQSDALYEKMCDELARIEPERYSRLSERDDDGNSIQVIAKDGSLKKFRLLDQMSAIRKHVKAFALVKGIVDIGDSATKIISKHAGLASADLMDLLGQYLAHFAILSTVYNGGETEPTEPLAHKLGYFPRDLHGKIAKGYRELSEFLDEYANASKKMLAEFPVKN